MCITPTEEMESLERNEKESPASCAACEGAALCGRYRIRSKVQ